MVRKEDIMYNYQFVKTAKTFKQISLVLVLCFNTAIY